MGENVNLNARQSLSQKEQILRFMEAGNSINPLQALKLFGCFRLGARVADLKKDGYPISSRFITTSTGKRVKEYSLG